MLLNLKILLLLSNSITSRRDKSILYSKITITILLISAFTAYDDLAFTAYDNLSLLSLVTGTVVTIEPIIAKISTDKTVYFSAGIEYVIFYIKKNCFPLLQWDFTNPPKPHGFTSLALQSSGSGSGSGSGSRSNVPEDMPDVSGLTPEERLEARMQYIRSAIREQYPSLDNIQLEAVTRVVYRRETFRLICERWNDMRRQIVLPLFVLPFSVFDITFITTMLTTLSLIIDSSFVYLLFILEPLLQAYKLYKLPSKIIKIYSLIVKFYNLYIYKPFFITEEWLSLQYQRKVTRLKTSSYNNTSSILHNNNFANFSNNTGGLLPGFNSLQHLRRKPRKVLNKHL